MRPRPNICGVGLYHCKDDKNLGSVLRAAHAFNASFVSFSGNLTLPSHCAMKTDTSRAVRQIPVFKDQNILMFKPALASLVCDELTDDATSLVTFRHPQQAYYVFGPENGSLSTSITDKANRVVKIPTTICLNLAAAVNIVLYDRLAKATRGRY